MRKKITIVGGGACSLMLGCALDPKKFDVHIYEKNVAPGRKFLVAGDGGFNLSHSEGPDDFIKRYTPAGFLNAAFSHFTNQNLVAWLQALGIATYAGSSGRLFPENGTKPIEVLNAFLKEIKENGVTWHFKQEWTGFAKNGQLFFKQGDAEEVVKSDYVIFCLGGASWPVTGSTGSWKNLFSVKQLHVKEFMASNCAFKVEWDAALISKTEGRALKNIIVRCGDAEHAGEVVITRFGLEGSGIYPLSPQIREQLQTGKPAEISIDLKPAVTQEGLLKKIRSKPVKTNFTAHVRTQLHLSDVQMALLKSSLSKEAFLNAEALCAHIKNLKLYVSATGPVDAAISTVGGISLDEVNDFFELKKMPGHFAVGEMLDYDAPTGGYLLQSCFSMGKFLADHLNAL